MRSRLLSLALAGVLAAPLVEGGRSGMEIDATIGGADVATADSADPIRIDPRDEIPLSLTIRNEGDHVEEVRYVRLEGKALGLTFLTYDLGVRATLKPGGQTTVDTSLDFFDLERQATGYLGTSLRVYNPERQLLAEQSFVVDVRGKATSTLGLFALVVVALAAFSVAVLIANTVRRRLPSNRFVRGLQFALAGSAIGLTLSLGVSILRVAFADVEAWVPLVFLPTVIGFALGYIAPGPLSRSIRDVREEDALQVVARVAVARASGIHDVASSGGFAPSHLSGPHEAAAELHDRNRSGGFSPSHLSGPHEAPEGPPGDAVDDAEPVP